MSVTDCMTALFNYPQELVGNDLGAMPERRVTEDEARGASRLHNPLGLTSVASPLQNENARIHVLVAPRAGTDHRRPAACLGDREHLGSASEGALLRERTDGFGFAANPDGPGGANRRRYHGVEAPGCERDEPSVAALRSRLPLSADADQGCPETDPRFGARRRRFLRDATGGWRA